MSRAVGLHVGLILLLLAMNFVLPAYHHGNLARIMVLAVYAMSYNIMFGYTGLLSLGHAMFFTAGMYGMGLSMRLWDMPVGGAFLVGIVAAAGFSLVFVLLRRS